MRHVPRFTATTDDTGRPGRHLRHPRLRRTDRHHQPDRDRRMETGACPGRAEPDSGADQEGARMTKNACDKCGAPIPPATGAFCDPCADAIWDHHYDRHDDGDSE